MLNSATARNGANMIDVVDTAAAQPRFVPRRSKQWSTRVRLLRHLTQAILVGWVFYALWGRATGGEKGGSVEAFCPFGGFETAFKWITTGRTVSHVHSSNLVLAGVVVVLALTARGFFCGWLCPLGSIQEGIRGVGRAVSKRVPFFKKAHKRLVAAMPWLPKVDRALMYGRYAVLVWAIVGAAITGTMVFREYDPWAALISIVEFEISTAFMVLVLVLTLSLFMDRPFCRYACPLGAAQGVIAKLSPVSIQRDASTCLGCDICNNACPMNIPVNTRTRVTDGTCIGCMECVTACPSEGALAVRVALLSRASSSAATRFEEEVR